MIRHVFTVNPRFWGSWELTAPSIGSEAGFERQPGSRADLTRLFGVVEANN